MAVVCVCECVCEGVCESVSLSILTTNKFAIKCYMSRLDRVERSIQVAHTHPQDNKFNAQPKEDI